MADPSPTNNATHPASSAAAASAASATANASIPPSAPANSLTAHAPRRTPPRHKPRPVIYKSSNLNKTAPELVARANPEKVSAVRSIQAANEAAERVRDAYRVERTAQALGEAIVGTDDESNAKKYERRLKMNRQSAAASRVRREAYTKALEGQLITMESNYNEVLAMLERERAANRLLQSSMEESAATGDPNAAASTVTLDVAEQGSNVESNDEESLAHNAVHFDMGNVVDDAMHNVEAYPVHENGAMEGSTGAAVEVVNQPVQNEYAAEADPLPVRAIADKTEDLLLLDDSLLAAQLQLPPELIRTLNAPTNLPLPDYFWHPEQAPPQNESSHLFDNLGL